MSLPKSSDIEIPLLQELVATGGADDLRFLYERLIAYFPQLLPEEIAEIKAGENKNWRRVVQKSGKILDQKKFIERDQGFWKITPLGRNAVENETLGFTLTKTKAQPLSHTNIQGMLVEIADFLGFYAQTEFELYDVVWRETEKNQRLSHVFEVQSKGNLDSAFAKLKRAYDAQRSKPFLILASERDSKRAIKSLNQEFQNLSDVITILSFVELKKMYDNLKAISAFLPKFLDV